MGRSSELLEADVGDRLSLRFRESGLLVLTRIRLRPYEFDVVLFDPRTLLLASIEIKRRSWRQLLAQSLRASMYCHFNIVAMPVEMRDRIPLEAFRDRGIGVYFYEDASPGINVSVALSPANALSPNRMLKQELYRRFYSVYGDCLYA